MEDVIKALNEKGLKFTRRVFEFNYLLTSEYEDTSTEINKQEFEKDYVLHSLQKYLREKHNIHLVVWWIDTESKFYYEIGHNNPKIGLKAQGGKTNVLYNTYEEALKIGLLEALKMI